MNSENRTDKKIQNSMNETLGYEGIGGFSNPIKNHGLQRTNRQTVNRLYSSYNKTNSKTYLQDYADLLKELNAIFATNFNSNQLFYSLHNILVNHELVNFTALGLVSDSSQCINVRLLDKAGSSYMSKILLTAEDNLIIKAFNTRQNQINHDSDFLKIPYLSKSQVIVFPLLVKGDVLGVYIIGCESQSITLGVELYNLITRMMSYFIQNEQLSEIVTKNTDIDSLTGLANHKSLQEELASQLKIAQQNDSKVSICLFDILNISQINREFGHAKGDEIIKAVANKISQNNRNTDFAGRYGGDEIAVIMPGASTEEAKYVAEYLNYTISCIYIDDVGPVKVSAGIATYPDTTVDQEKLLILAEQAMGISKSKSYESGNSVIVTSQDVDFWDDDALKSFAEILIRRHAQIGINFEEELVSKFHDEKIISNQHLLEVVKSLASTIDAKDTYTKGHSTSVSRYSEALARAINLPEVEVERIKLGALLHDIGKIGIPENILRKPTMLNDEEWEIMKQHPTIGADKVLAPNESLRDLIPMVKFHHEHYDGTGYPFGLKGEEIPLSARIVSIADAFHALVSDRPYRKGLSINKACEILKMGANVQWDRELVRQFVQIAPSLSTSV
ncbi:MAG: diguanylate cyclase [Cyanobacteria bacterium SIG30]|nr:diguanylate cyclase [Cyanobacteria bacterium SIG30]